MSRIELRREQAPSLDPALLAFMEGVATHGATFIPLMAALKRPAGKFQRYELAQAGASAATRMEGALKWLRQGREIGFLPSGKLWVLDADGPEAAALVEAWVNERGLCTPAIATPGGGSHSYFQLPEGLCTEGLKAHVLHPRDPSGCPLPFDFKFPGRTLVKLIGRGKDGNCYRVRREWTDPPPLDPREFLPSLQIYKLTDQPWIPFDRPLRDRICRARTYLLRLAPTSVSGRGGRKTLLEVCTHLTQYLRIDQRLAYRLLAEEGHGGRPSWNDRCRDKAGTPYPWSPNELITFLDESKTRVPAQGVRDFELHQQKTALADALARFFSEILHHLDAGRPSFITMADLRKGFCAWYGEGETAILPIPFGKAAAKAGLTIVQVTQAKVSAVRGIDRNALSALLGSLAPARGSAS